jgi:hypothetical protein
LPALSPVDLAALSTRRKRRMRLHSPAVPKAVKPDNIAVARVAD